MLHGGLGIAVKLEFEKVYAGGCHEYHIHSAMGRVDLNVDEKLGEEREDDEKHLLIVALMVAHIAVGDSSEVILKQMESSVDVTLSDIFRHIGHGYSSLWNSKRCDVVGEEAVEKADAYFAVGEVEGVEGKLRVVCLDGEVAALIE